MRTPGWAPNAPRVIEPHTSIGRVANCAPIANRRTPGPTTAIRVGILSDTHGFLDEAVFEYFAQCDQVWHAGDLGSVEVLDRLGGFKPVRVVYGNVDGQDVRSAIPEDEEFECAGMRIYMTHIGGHPGRYERRAKRELERRRPHLFVCGHSHILRVERDPRFNLLYLNPGACGNTGWHKVRTLLRMTLEAGRIAHAEAIELGPRGRSSL